MQSQPGWPEPGQVWEGQTTGGIVTQREVQRIVRGPGPLEPLVVYKNPGRRTTYCLKLSLWNRWKTKLIPAGVTEKP